MKQFVKSLFGFSIGPVIGAIMSFITIPITTYFISPAEYGKVTMFTLIQSIASMVVCLGIDQSYTRFYNEVKDKKKLLFNCMLVPILTSVLLMVLMAAFPHQISNLLFEADQYTLAIYLLVAMVPLMIFERFLLLSVRMQEKSVQYSILSICVKFFTLVLTLIFILGIRRDFLAVVYATALGQILSDILIVVINRKMISFDFHLFDKELFKKLMKFGLPLLIVAIIGWALNSMDKVFLRVYSDFEEIGYYNVAMKIANLLLVIQSCFTAFWVPTAYRWYEQKEPEEKFNFVSHVVAMGMSFLFVGILLVKDLIPILVSKSYETSIYIMPFLLFYPIMYTMSETTTLGITFSKKSHLNIIVSVLSIITNLGLNFLLVPTYHAVGAAVATGVAYIVFFWARTLISRKLWNPFPIRNYVWLTVIIVVTGFVNVMSRNIMVSTIVNVGAILLLIVVYRDTIKQLFEIVKRSGKFERFFSKNSKKIEMDR